MILDYEQPVDFNCVKSLRRFRRWLSFKMANYVGCIEYIKDTNKHFKNPEHRILGCDYKEAIKNIESVMNAHWAVSEIIKVIHHDNTNRRNDTKESSGS